MFSIILGSWQKVDWSIFSVISRGVGTSLLMSGTNLNNRGGYKNNQSQASNYRLPGVEPNYSNSYDYRADNRNRDSGGPGYAWGQNSTIQNKNPLNSMYSGP